LCFFNLGTTRLGARWVFAFALDDALVDPTTAFGHAIDVGGGRTVQTAMLLCGSAAEAAAGNDRRRFRRRFFGRSRGHDVLRRQSRRGHAEKCQKEEEEDGVDAVAELHGSSSGYGGSWWVERVRRFGVWQTLGLVFVSSLFQQNANKHWLRPKIQSVRSAPPSQLPIMIDRGREPGTVAIGPYRDRNDRKLCGRPVHLERPWQPTAVRASQLVVPS
jgi:hypothetical protein